MLAVSDTLPAVAVTDPPSTVSPVPPVSCAVPVVAVTVSPVSVACADALPVTPLPPEICALWSTVRFPALACNVLVPVVAVNDPP